MSSQDDKKYQHFIKSIFISRFIGEIASLVISSGAKKIIDIGCGEGYSDQLLLGQLSGIKIVGVDKNEQFLKKARTRNPQVTYQKGDIYKMEGRQEFDLALVMEVLEHLENPNKAIKEIKKTAKKAIFSVPLEPWFSLASFFSGSYLRNWGRHPDHINSWNSHSFAKMLKEHFSVVRINIAFPWLIGFCSDEK